ncbi:hypothetical protein LSH36_291g05009 [Paralvinella palmiformis]|uniref:Uncharacterized protein n=1 Tax=Paralvinella palmiformis TaxID=53620 RepID=A0AAD9JJI7_9ANNE|nr:hypothetical protein LSH36_291g05009 [Paralvinella palmiformis]
MTSLHRKWSPKVAVATTKVDDGGVAACLNWSYGTRSKKQTEQQEQKEQKEQNDIQQFREAVDRVLLDMRIGKDDDSGKPSSPEPSIIDDLDDRPVTIRQGDVSRMVVRPPTPIQSRPTTAPVERRNNSEQARPQTGGKCLHVASSDRVTIKPSQVRTEPRTTETATNTMNQQQPLSSTKKFLKKYFNKPLSDDELKYILRETHKRISDDLVEAALQERSKRDEISVPKPPIQTRLLRGQTRPERILTIPRQQYQLDLGDQPKPRPASAHGVPRDNVLATSRMVRPGSAVPLTGRAPEVTSRNKHFSAWRPNGVVPRNGWTQSCNNYDDLWRLAAKYRSKRREAPKMLGACRYTNKHNEVESQYLRFRPSSQNGNMSLQLNCCQDTDMTINIRLQKSRAGSAY